MVKQVGSGRKASRGAGRAQPKKHRAKRKGQHERVREKTSASSAKSGRASARQARPTRNSSPKAGREGIVRDVQTPGINGQVVSVEDRDGDRWQVECLGEPLEVGARILFLPVGHAGGRHGEMVRLVEARRTTWVCTLTRNANGIRLTPFGGVGTPELNLTEKDSKGAEDGFRVVVAPLAATKSSSRKLGRDNRSSGAGRGRPTSVSVRVREVLGKPFDPDADYQALAWKHRLPSAFSRRARLEVEDIADVLTPGELNRRVDLRHLPFVTIDPASARDHDDAVFAEHRRSSPVALVDSSGVAGSKSSKASRANWAHRLWVAIADVSHFVLPGGWIDAEARRRGNSFYFPDRALPMLPERLSTDLCSLRSGVDRFALVAEIRIRADGIVADTIFHEAVICSRADLTYEAAHEWLLKNRTRRTDSTSEWGDSLLCLDEIAKLLGQTRRAAGALTLELVEVEIDVNAEGRAIDARMRERNPAHELVEESMLCANRVVAQALDVAERETIHRAHPPPSAKSLTALSALLLRFGIDETEDLVEPGVLAKLLDRVRGLPSEERIHLAVLRSMSQARYEPVSQGHFALRFSHYVHFTSPIRRYADLEVHRALKSLIRGEARGDGDRKTAMSRAARLAIWLSGRERVATDVERDASALASCSLLAGREGEKFEATVTGVTEYGLFVRLSSPAVSGLIPMRNLDGYWNFDEEAEMLVGEKSGRKIGLGEVVSVLLVETDSNRARITFRLDAGRAESKAPKSSKTRKSPVDVRQ